MVFLPLISITGVTGTFFRALAVTMGVALLTSLALALTWTPTLEPYFMLRRDRATARRSRRKQTMSSELLAAEESSMNGFFGRIVEFYERWLRRALEHPRAGWRSSAPALIAGFVRLLSATRLRPAAGDGRRRLHPRLHHAGRQLAAGNQSHRAATWNRFCATRRRWRALRAAPACNWDWRR